MVMGVSSTMLCGPLGMEVEVIKAVDEFDGVWCSLKHGTFLPLLLVATGEGVRSRLQDVGEDAEHRQIAE